MKRSMLPVLIGASILFVISARATADGTSTMPLQRGSSVLAAAIVAGVCETNATAVSAISGKGRDGAACSSDDDCKSGVCEGGSCCTDHGDPCDSSSHCCGHQSCKDGSCP